MNPEIIVVGSLNIDLVVGVRHFPGPGETITGSSFRTFCGGKGANQAYAAAKLGARTAMIGQVGNDDAGKAQVSNLAAAGVDTRHILIDPAAPTGTAVIAVQEDGENRIIIVPGANGSFTPDRLAASEPLLRSARIALFQLELPLATVAQAIEYARAGGAIIILDPAPAPDGNLPDALLAQVDYLTPNASELIKLTGSLLNENSSLDYLAAEALLLVRRGARKVLAKLGARGVVIVTSSTVEHVPAFSVTPVDTTAAGDCFNAAFAVAHLEGKSDRDAVLFANAAAACSVTRPGAQCSMPDRAEVEALIQQQSNL